MERFNVGDKENLEAETAHGANRGTESINDEPNADIIFNEADETVNSINKDEKREKIILPEEEREAPLKEIMEKYGVSKPTASRARERGFLWKGYHIPTNAFLPAQKSKVFKNIVELTDEERKMSASEIAEKFNIEKESAYEVRKRGWVKMPGRAVSILDNAKLPEGVSMEEVIHDGRIGAFWAAKRCGMLDEFENAAQEALLRLLEQTAVPGFVNPLYRKKIAKSAALKYLNAKVFKHSNKEITGQFEDDIFEDVGGELKTLEEKEHSDLSESEKKIFLRGVKDRLGVEKYKILQEWAESDDEEMPENVAEIIRETREKNEEEE